MAEVSGERTVPWGEHTITNVWSTTKTVTNLAARMLSTAGSWPCTRRCAITGRSPPPTARRRSRSGTCSTTRWGSRAGRAVRDADIYDWELSTGRLAAQAPWWEPGTASGYRGSLIIADQRRRATISYMMNRMAPGIIGSPRSESYVRAVYGCLS